MTTPTEDTVRVTMNWPKDLKDEVREKVGSRKMTDYTIEAVRERLERERPTLQISDEARAKLAAAPGTDLPERRTPSINEPMGDREDHRPMFMTGRPTETVRVAAFEDDLDGPSGLSIDDDDQADEFEPADESAPEHATPPSAREPKNDLFERVRANAAEMGHELKPASEVLAPERIETPVQTEERRPTPVPEPLVQAPNFPDPGPVPKVEQPVAAPAANTCPNCGSVLIDGECWECM